MKNCGRNFQVTHDAIIKGVSNFEIGDNVFIANRVILMGSGTIRVEDDVLIGPSSIIVSGNHTLENGAFRYGKIQKGDIVICHGSWICANSTLGAGAVLPRGCVLGANSFLSKKLTQEFCLYGGSPAKFVKSLI